MICFCCIPHTVPGFAVRGIEGPVSGIPVTADSGKKILLLKGKERGVCHFKFSLYVFLPT
jgi:hypothetical protein